MPSDPAGPDPADRTDPAWRLLAAHQRGPDGFCRTCADHWPCALNGQAVDALAEAAATATTTATHESPRSHAEP
ncbi:hypothetical protein AB0I28_21415 [Phytomonospora sp. NPDC050363]|uniref:hypothetical protein n=1 Tax=Phytomonospora sp. NPDC050363 TaxID=3155642 RepID=UPI00341095A3